MAEAKKINRTQKKVKLIPSKPKINTIAATKRCSVPLAPPPPSAPSAPHGPVSDSNINPPKPRASAPEIDVATQLQNMKLKKVIKEKKKLIILEEIITSYKMLYLLLLKTEEIIYICMMRIMMMTKRMIGIKIINYY